MDWYSSAMMYVLDVTSRFIKLANISTIKTDWSRIWIMKNTFIPWGLVGTSTAFSFVKMMANLTNLPFFRRASLASSFVYKKSRS